MTATTRIDIRSLHSRQVTFSGELCSHHHLVATTGSANAAVRRVWSLQCTDGAGPGPLTIRRLAATSGHSLAGVSPVASRVMVKPTVVNRVIRRWNGGCSLPCRRASCLRLRVGLVHSPMPASRGSRSRRRGQPSLRTFLRRVRATPERTGRHHHVAGCLRRHKARSGMSVLIDTNGRTNASLVRNCVEPDGTGGHCAACAGMCFHWTVRPGARSQERGRPSGVASREECLHSGRQSQFAVAPAAAKIHFTVSLRQANSIAALGLHQRQNRLAAKSFWIESAAHINEDLQRRGIAVENEEG